MGFVIHQIAREIVLLPSLVIVYPVQHSCPSIKAVVFISLYAIFGFVVYHRVC